MNKVKKTRECWRKKTIQLLPTQTVDLGPRPAHHLLPLATGRTAACRRRTGSGTLSRQQGRWMCNWARQETGRPWPTSALGPASHVQLAGVLAKVADLRPVVAQKPRAKAGGQVTVAENLLRHDLCALLVGDRPPLCGSV